MTTLRADGYETPVLLEVGDFSHLTLGGFGNECPEWFGGIGVWTC
ncbi:MULTISPECIES: lasso RiPP family leader peptide-containing protein [Streptomyces]